MRTFFNDTLLHKVMEHLMSDRVAESVASRSAEARGHLAGIAHAAPHAIPPLNLAVEAFSLFYGAFQAINDISLEIAERRITAIIGPSGCGKSSLLRSINRMNDLTATVRTEGAIRLAGKNIYDADVDAVLLRRHIGMVFQRPNLFPISIFENVAYGLRIAGWRDQVAITERVHRALRQTALWDEVKDRLNHSALGLSGGQQQRLCIARAIAVAPEVLLLDEPTSALDPIAMLKIEELIRELSQHYTIVVVTHNMQQAARISDFTAYMLADEQRAGRVIEFGLTKQIFSSPRDRRTEDYITGRFG